MGKVCALLLVAFVLLTTGVPPLTSGCGITARVTMMDENVEVANEARTLALVGEEVIKIEIRCRSGPPPYRIYHDGTLLTVRSQSENPWYVLEEFGVEQQGVYRCVCDSGENSLNLLLVPGFADDHFVGTAIEGNTVHLPCQLTNMHPNLRNLYVVRWRRDNDEISYGDKYSKLPNNSLVIKDFDEEDTGKSFTCYIRQIGSYDFQGEYPESGPRQLRMLEMPDPEILTGGGTVSCSASTPFNASYCLTITYSDGQHKTEKCKPKEVKVRASGSIQNIICNVTVFSNASVPRAYLQATKDWKTPSNSPTPEAVTSTIAAAVSAPVFVFLLMMVVLIVVVLVCCYMKAHLSAQPQNCKCPEQVDGGESAGGQAGPNEAGPAVGNSPDSPCTALATINPRPPIPGGSAPSSLAAPLPTDNVQRQLLIRIPSVKKMGGRERPASPAESIHDYVAPLQCSLKRQRPTHLKCNLMVYSDHTLPSPPVIPQQPALPAPVVVHFQTGSNVDQLWPRTPPNWPVHSSRLNTPQNRPTKVSPLALRSQTSVTTEDRTFYAELTPLPQSQEMRIQSNPVVMASQQPRSNGHDSAMETSSSASSIGQSSPQPSPEGTTPPLHLTSSAR